MEILELKNTVTDIKSPVDGFNIRMERREERISELDGGIEECQKQM